MLLETVADYDFANDIHRIADALEQAQWKEGTCSSCGFNYIQWALTNPNNPNYCPNCGKKME